MTPEFTAKWQAVLSSPRWRALRARLIATRGEQCERCRKTWAPGAKPRLVLHHLTYERLGAELDADVQLVCGNCHEGADRERARCNAAKAEAALFDARLDGWASKVYGEEWEESRDFDRVVERFERWLDRRGE